MPLRSLAICLLLAITSAASAIDASRDDPTAKLIAQLADPQYALRRDAAWRLLEAGPRVSDALFAAQTGAAQAGANPELAASSTRLAEQLTPQWTKFDASPTVRAAMQRYATHDEAGRYRTVRELLDQSEAAEPSAAIGALCRIARFEPSPLVARSAAAAIIGELANQAEEPAPTFSLGQVRSELVRLDESFGPSNRDTARWLSALVADESPTKQLEAWRSILTAEQQFASAQPGATSPAIVWAVAWQTLRTALASDDPTIALETWNVVVKVADETERVSNSSVQALLTAIADAKAWQVGDVVLRDYSELFDTKLRKYLAAELRLRQGADEQAAELADNAARFVTPEGLDPFAQQQLDERFFVAITLGQRGQMDWAEAEFTSLVAQAESVTQSGALGRWYFASHLYDLERYDEAATLLAELHTAINANTRASRRYLQLIEQQSQSSSIELPEPEMIAARKCYYAGLAAQGAAATKQLRESLLLNRDDADVLIAYYRSTAPTSTLRRDALREIDALAHEFESAILAEPSDPVAYNQWAWLVSNTEGDTAKAVRYSQRSLELRPGDAGYLDTLARCHYAAGDIAAAIATQSAAVAKEPHIPALNRQLKFFQSKK